MRAIVQKGYGAPAAVLELAEVDQPRPSRHQVLLRVHAAGINPADFAVAQGKPYLVRLASGLFKPRRAIGGSDVAGTVEAVGAAVTRFRPGDEIFGAAQGSFAEFAVANEKDLVQKPATTTFEQAAATPMAGLVALQALSDKANLQPGQTVLITGAGGGIGSFAVQIARIMGAEVTGVCSTDKLDLVRSLGATHVIDYRQQDFTENGELYDVILDNAGHSSLKRLRCALHPQGVLVPNDGRFDRPWLSCLDVLLKAPILSELQSQKLRPFLSLPNTEDLETLRSFLASGELTPVVGRTFPLEETAKALTLVGEGHAKGKIVVRV